MLVPRGRGNIQGNNASKDPTRKLFNTSIMPLQSVYVDFNEPNFPWGPTLEVSMRAVDTLQQSQTSIIIHWYRPHKRLTCTSQARPPDTVFVYICSQAKSSLLMYSHFHQTWFPSSPLCHLECFGSFLFILRLMAFVE